MSPIPSRALGRSIVVFLAGLLAVCSAGAQVPGLVISEMLANPGGTDSPFEFVELRATRAIDFSVTPYALIVNNNGTATASGWIAGGGLTYAFAISSGTVATGDVVYVGGSSMSPTGTKLRVIDTGTTGGDGGIGNASASGVFGNGGNNADGVAVFDMALASVTSASVPIDAIFFGSGLGAAVVNGGADGYQLPVNDAYSGGKLQASSFLAPNNVNASFLTATGTLNTVTNTWTTPRVWANTATVTDGTSSVTLDASAGVPDLTINDVTVTEGNAGTTTASFTVSLSAPAPAGGVSFDIATADGSATVADNDYVAQSLTGQTIAAGNSTFTFDVVVNGDLIVEANETFNVNVGSVTGATVTDGQGVGTINNDDLPPDLTINDVTVTEGNAGTTTASFTVSLSAPAPAGGVSFDIATADGSATVADNDYVAQSLTGQTIAAGNSTFTFNVLVNGDLNVEANETFNVNVGSVTGATVTDGQGVGTINNDDFPPDISINDATVTEGNAGTTTASFTVSLSTPAPPGGVTFDIATQDNTATVADNDYVAQSLVGQTIAAGNSTFTFDVVVNGDLNVEANETFNVNVGSVTGATVTDGQGVGTINNDDTASDLSVAVIAAPDPVMPGDTLTYTVNGSNAGPDAATNAQVSLSFTTAFQSLSGPAGWSCTSPAIGAAGTVACSIASLPVGGFTFSVQSTVPFGTAPGALTANAFIGADNSDPTPANNTDSAAVTVVAGPSLPVVPVPLLHDQLALWLAALFLGLGLVAVTRRNH